MNLKRLKAEKRVRLSLIWAMDRNRLIGKDNDLPWRLPGDLAYFKKVTMGHPVLMGRRTYESIGKPLPGRKNVILTSDQRFHAEGCTVVHSVEEALETLEGEDVFVTGGAKVYEALLPLADKLFVTVIDHAFDGDAYFPHVDFSEWRLIAAEKGVRDENNPYEHEFRVYERTR